MHYSLQESAGRTLVATSPSGDKKELCMPPPSAPIGERIHFAAVPAGTAADNPIAPKRLHEILKHLHTGPNKTVQYENHDFLTSAGPCTVQTIENGTVA